MAAKRFFEDSGTDPNEPNQKRPKTKLSFASVIKDAVLVNFLQNYFCSALEPMLRRVVNEEVENGLRRCSRQPMMTKSPSLRIQALEPSSLRLIFSKKLTLPIFTGSKIVDVDNNPLQILLVDTRGDGKVPTSLPYSVKVEVVVLDGDFPAGDGDTWSSEEFNRNVVKERTGKRPLLTGDLNVTMRDGYVSVGDIEFTDNSSWIRSRKFRIGARVIQVGSGQSVIIREAMTESFTVKDHRGELYKKHHPPALNDEVWRLEKIGKDGAFHRKLAEAGIRTVQDFLKMSYVDPPRLKKILGIGMSEKMWEVTQKHARSCVMGNKIYVSRGPNFTLYLNATCQVIKAIINGQVYPTRELSNIQRAYIENLVRDAYARWDALEEIEGPVNEIPLLTQGDQMMDPYPTHQQTMVRAYQQSSHFLTDGSSDQQVEFTAEWVVNSGDYLGTPMDGYIRYLQPESSSDGDLP